MRDSTPNTFTVPKYNKIQLLAPRRPLDLASSPELGSLHSRIVVHLATQWGVVPSTITSLIPLHAIAFGRVHIEDGDTIYAHEMYKMRHGLRDATFLQYELLYDRLAHRRNADPEFKPRTYYGRLLNIVVIDLPIQDGLPITEPTTHVLLDILPCNTDKDQFGCGFLEFTGFRAGEVVEATAARAVIGTIRDRGKWVIVKRNGGLEHAEYMDLDDDPSGGFASE